MSITDKRLTEIQARIEAATHEFLPVNGHPDDDECTNRADGTDDTYCGEPEAAHDVIPEEFSLDLADLLAEVHRLRGKLADAWDEGAEYAWSETCEGFNGEYTGEAGTHDGKASFRSQMPEIENPYRKEDQS